MADSILRLHAADNTAVATVTLRAGSSVSVGDCCVSAVADIPAGHKIALQGIRQGEPIVKFGQKIGYASEPIAPGDWIHVHNVQASKPGLEFEFGTEVRELPSAEPRTFEGYRRHDGRCGTRNYLAIVSTVNCSATTARYVAQELAQTDLADYPNIDGIVPLVHKAGCAMAFGDSDHHQLNRTLAGFAKHPNVAASLVLGLGCETAQADYLQEQHGLVQLGGAGEVADEAGPMVMNIQEIGGIRRTVDRAAGVLRDLLPIANDVTRQPIPVSELKVALECGGSDGNSGITANPAVGVAADLLVARGGTAILSETPEMYGAEHLMTRRAISREVGEQLLSRIRWWEDYAERNGVTIDNNPSVGNKKGGLTTIYEKSLGAIAKAGTSPLRAVYRYAEPVTERGFVIMDSPGFDPASVTGKVAGGAQVVVFTTGRGSCFGCKPSPTIKVATNTPMYQRMSDDMDLDAGTILDGKSVEAVGEQIFERIVATASGEPTLSEAQGIGDDEFCPWQPGPIF
ncbi:MAG: altronate dehydratase family protein [Fuerstiella sp.]|nr:altronate dehydratase family protein [Fuerstiella sp.]